MHKATLYFDPTGPLVCYEGGLLKVSDLNPEIETQWRMSRSELFWFALRALRASIFWRGE